MGTGIGLRFFLFEADGSLRRLSTRVVAGLRRGNDRLPQYAGQRLRFALAFLRLDAGGRPASVEKVEASWWEFDANGSVARSRLDALREALEARHTAGDEQPIVRDGNTVDLAGLLARRRRERRWRWTPTPSDVTKIVHAIWPGTAGGPAGPPPLARGTLRRRHPMSLRAREAA